MATKIALKRLTKSDLTIFEWQFRNRNAGNQKSINLNTDVFIDSMYPDADAYVLTEGLPVPVTIYGPGFSNGISVRSTITPKSAETNQKNWRLGGPLIHDPIATPDRFHVLEPGDLVVMSFNGDPVPTEASLLFVAYGHPDDVLLHAALDELISGGKRTMVPLSSGDLEAVAAAVSLTANHPFPDAVLGDIKADFESDLFGIGAGVRWAKRGRQRNVTAVELVQARTNAQRIGRDGEILVNAYLATLVYGGTLSEATWVADKNAAAPLDFHATWSNGDGHCIDAKTTTGPFQRNFHISAAEIAYAANSAEPYYIFRVFELGEEGAMLRVSDDIRPAAQTLIKSLSGLTAGYEPDSFSVDPNYLNWVSEVHLVRPEE